MSSIVLNKKNYCYCFGVVVAAVLMQKVLIFAVEVETLPVMAFWHQHLIL